MSASKVPAQPVAKSMSVPDFRVHALVLCPFTALNHDLAYVRLIDACCIHMAFRHRTCSLCDQRERSDGNNRHRQYVATDTSTRTIIIEAATSSVQ